MKTIRSTCGCTLGVQLTGPERTEARGPEPVRLLSAPDGALSQLKGQKMPSAPGVLFTVSKNAVQVSGLVNTLQAKTLASVCECFLAQVAKEGALPDKQ